MESPKENNNKKPKVWDEIAPSTAKLEKTESELFDRNHEPKEQKRHEFHQKKSSLPTDWSSNNDNMKKKPKKKKHLMYSKNFRRLFFVALLFFVGSLIFAMLTFVQGNTTVSNKNIDILVLGNSFVDGGETLPLQVKVANRNRTSLEIADLLVEYSRGAGGSNDIVRDRVSLGEIRAGGIAEEIVDVVVFGEQGTVRDIHFTLEYRVSNSNAIFVKDYTYSVNVANSPVDVLVEGPSDVVSNQVFETEITVVQNSTESAENMIVVAQYPSGFKFESATPEPDFGDDTWVLGDLAPGAKKVITLRGSIKAQSGEQRIITILSGSQNPSDEQEIGVQFTATPYQIEVGTPFISAQVSYNGESSNEFNIGSAQESSFSLEWENKLDTSVSDAEIILQFSGNAFDPTRVSVSQGFFDTNSKKIIWNGNNTSVLENVSPGQKGSLFFTITPKQGVSNPTIEMSVSASGILVGQSTQRDVVENIYTGTARVQSDAQVSAEVLHYAGPFTNTGSIPASVGQETTYTIELSVQSPVNDLENTEVTIEIPSYVAWKNKTFPSSEDLSYNSATREITWDIGDLSSGTGASSKRTVSFQLGVTPSGNHVGLSPTIIDGAELRGKDSFTGTDIFKKINALTISLFKDTNYNAANDAVVE